MVVDAWSMAILNARTLDFLRSVFQRAKSRLYLPSPCSTRNTPRNRNWLQGEVLESQLSYWKHLLDSSPPMLNLPTDRPRPARQSFCGASMPVALSESLTEAINELSRREACHSVHDAARGVQCITVSLFKSGRYPRRLSYRPSPPSRKSKA